MGDETGYIEESTLLQSTNEVQAGEPIPVSGRLAGVASVNLDTGLLWSPAAGMYEVPTYRIVTDDGTDLMVVALTEESLALQD